jgi:phage portal protein BeeE
MKFVPLQWTPEDMQFLEARQFTVGEIAHMFNLDPTDLGAALLGDSMTYANIEQRQVQRTVDTYSQWMRRVEEETSDCLPGANVAKLVPANLQRTDTKTTAETDQLQVGTSVRSVDELRKRDGLKPLPKPAPPPQIPGAPAGAPAPAAPANGEPIPGTPIPGTDITTAAVKVKE